MWRCSLIHEVQFFKITPLMSNGQQEIAKHAQVALALVSSFYFLVTL
jgi:hypothetical protein